MKARILLVEDNESQGRHLEESLTRLEYDVRWVRSGLAAVRLAKEVEPDLILLDIILDDVDGFSVCRWLRTAHETRRTPVIMLTARDQLRDKVHGFNLGANDYLLKPFDPAELDARIHVALRARARYEALLQRNAELETLVHSAEQQATIDPLTGACNRRRFDDVLQREVAATKRYGQALCCVLLDVDHFKKINDRYGHPAGDSVLKEIAARLLGALREVDLVARYGGEEFAVLLPHTSSAGGVTAVTRIAQSLRQPAVPLGEERVLVTASFGIACTSETGAEDFRGLVKAADLALYKAKQNGRDRIELYTAEFASPASDVEE